VKRFAGRIAVLFGIGVGFFGACLSNLNQLYAQGARSNTPEYFYQPASGVMSLGLEGHQLLSGSTSTSVSGVKTSDTKLSRVGYAIDYGYGFNDEWAFSVKMALDNTTSDVTTAAGSTSSYKQTGRSDIHLMLSNITALGGWNLNIGVGAALSPGKRLDQTASTEGNNLSGGTSVLNYIGLSTVIGSGNYVGGKVQYVTRTQATGNTNTSVNSVAQDYSIDGGNIATVGGFAATDLTPFAADLAVTYNFIDPIVYTYSASSTISASAYQTVQVETGAQYGFTSSVNLRLSYQLLMLSEQASSGATALAAHNQSAISFRLRFEF
jgi:hypothetical protein